MWAREAGSGSRTLIVAVPLPIEVMISGDGLRGDPSSDLVETVVWILIVPAAQSADNLFARGK